MADWSDFFAPNTTLGLPPGPPPGDGTSMSSYSPSPSENITSTLQGDAPVDSYRYMMAHKLAHLLGMTPPVAFGDAAHDRDPQAMAMALMPGSGEGKALMKGAEEGGSAALKDAFQQLKPRNSNVTRSTDLQNLRDLPVDDAVAIARKQPHLIKAGDQSEGYYVGGPRNVTGPSKLLKNRNNLYDYIATDPRGMDWYDRYRTGLNEINGGDPQRILWNANQEGQWSAGVSPESELQFALKENNASIAGRPVKSGRPAPHQAHMDAIDQNDPSLYQLGDKTGEYAEKIRPDPNRVPGATGVNDYRYAIAHGYTDPNGKPQRAALTDAQHRFIDHETALLVDRANQEKLAGRDDWTGERLQAAPWVVQKSNDFAKRLNIPYEEAFQKYGNRTIADYFDKHTAYGTYEAQPGAGIGHLPGLENAPQAEKDAYAADPRSRWDTAPMGRDAIYSGLGIPKTGNYMRVRPSLEMQGAYEGPNGMEYNRGGVARPLVAFDTDDKGTKSVAAGDKMLLNAGEGLRAFLDAQHGGGWHAMWGDAPVGASNSLSVPMNGKASPEQLKALMDRGAQSGLPNAIDRGSGVAMTDFGGGTDSKALGKDLKKGTLASDIKDITGSEPSRVKLDSNYLGYDWSKPGSGAATRELLRRITQTPEMRRAMNANQDVAKAALDRLERDAEASGKYGIAREDIQNARKIISQGGQWVDRLQMALKRRVLPLPAAAAVLGPVYQHLQGGSDTRS